MIAAAQAVALELAHRQRQLPVAAAVLQRDRLPVLLAIQDHRLAEKRPGERSAGQFTIPGGDVPGVTQKHGSTGLSPGALMAS
ncbi:hypothetical protein D3C83_98490 [compost metagenome]